MRFHILEPTRVTQNLSSDNLITNNLFKEPFILISDPGLSDPRAFFVSLEGSKNAILLIRMTNLLHSCLRFIKVDGTDYFIALLSSIFADFNLKTDAVLNYNYFLNTRNAYMFVFQLCLLSPSLLKGGGGLVWITEGIQVFSRIKRKLHQLNKTITDPAFK